MAVTKVIQGGINSLTGQYQPVGTNQVPCDVTGMAYKLFGGNGDAGDLVFSTTTNIYAPIDCVNLTINNGVNFGVTWAIYIRCTGNFTNNGTIVQNGGWGAGGQGAFYYPQPGGAASMGGYGYSGGGGGGGGPGNSYLPNAPGAQGGGSAGGPGGLGWYRSSTDGWQGYANYMYDNLGYGRPLLGGSGGGGGGGANFPSTAGATAVASGGTGGTGACFFVIEARGDVFLGDVTMPGYAGSVGNTTPDGTFGSGGGGGGAGGMVYVYYGKSFTNTGVVTLAGGAGGAGGAGSIASGSAGGLGGYGFVSPYKVV